ncbi:Glyoxalase/Bleomycin resistance protein/Dihydroxybiphenyl dioxygenase [Microdochium trichocladiopsis]|uniref:Glyoxalase/Bleomycin resistance protein/Dihydroxybiphenyl dioxygenase n=1 Tax=Microdochium trichocladiopsis TaxID=1682393 RepID=A0A9P8Y1I6_9PEZI|nr:Glyoxalase/Bleomycin resistance protein/Dihydroxybiphenyl dioxygenase [Microdochium trichocladiopsis]KAH7025116.1 Glyoxalase/Bleomycin resistance protein/Dihydroxybiphenyl dioxygenase [Microdochium trichocladiopsis]
MAGEWKAPKFGSPVWLGISASNVPRAREFYAKVFDWTFKQHSTQPDDPEKLAMFDFNPGVSLSGGIQKAPESTGVLQPGGAGVVIYWLVEDLDKSAAAIEAAGGSMLSGPEKEGESGMYRYFKDTEGTTGGIYQILSSCAN